MSNKSNEKKGFWATLKALLFGKEILVSVVQQVSKAPKPKDNPQPQEEEFSARYFAGKGYVEEFFINLPFQDGKLLFDILSNKPRKVDKDLATFQKLLRTIQMAGLPSWETKVLQEYAWTQKKGAWLYFYNLRDRKRRADSNRKV